MTTFPAYVPSKGRADACTTAKLLMAAGVPFRIVVEPQDAAGYAARFPAATMLELPADDKGLAFARNFILDHARRSGFGWFWMLDDDVTRFYSVRAGKCVPADAGCVLAEASTLVAADPAAAQGALEYQQFAWCAKKPTARNSYCDVVVAVHAGRVGRLKYRGEVDMKEDRDFTLQVLASGWRTVRLTRLAFACPKNGSNKGGLAPHYAAPGREAAASRRMAEIWGPDVCRFKVKAGGRPDVAVNWKFFRA